MSLRKTIDSWIRFINWFIYFIFQPFHMENLNKTKKFGTFRFILTGKEI